MKTKNFSLTQLGLSLLAKTFFFSVFSFLCVGSINAQKVAWAHFQNGNYLHSKFTTSSISWGTGSNRLKNPKTNAYFTEYVGFNQQFDVNGKVLFTVISTVNEVFLFDRNNKYVAPPSQMENTTLSPEISIVPLKAGVVYHILAGGLIWEYNIAKNSIADHANKKLEYGTYKITFGNSNNVKNSTMQSVRIVNDGCNPSYYIYCINANKHGTTDRYIEVLKVQEEANTINSSNSVFKITKIDSLNFTSSTIGSFDNFHCPMELSSDGSKLCVVGKNKILIYNVDPTTGKLAGLNNTYNIPSTSTEQIAGIEFANNTTVYFAYYDLYNATTSSRGIYHWNFTGTNSPVKITGSESFSNSMIEKGLDGKLYTLKADGIYVINTTTNTISNALTSSSNLIKQVDLYSYLIGGAPAGVSTAVYYLPDQIDGQTNEYLDLSETVFTYNLGASFSGSYNWSNASHGFTAKGSGKVLVLNAINITSASSPITMDGMTIEFYDDAVMNISPSSSVTLKGTILKASNCGLMWQGIKMMKGAGRLSSAGAQLFMKKNSSGQNTQVLDAHIGVNLFGVRHRLEITEQTLFTANERHLQITEGDKTKIKIWESNFNGSNILRDQNKGSNIGHNDNKYRTIDGITIIKSNVIIGDATKPHNNIFGGQNGVLAVESSLEMIKTNISFTKSRGLWFNANNVVNKELKITQSSFYNLNYGMRIEGKTAKTSIQQCSLYNTNAYAIQYIGNPGGKLTIGDETNAALGNSFNNCNWAAIHCDNNQKFIAPSHPNNSVINIGNNIIDNHIYASGISVTEPSPAPNASYGVLKINNNKIGLNQRMGRGINLMQVSGLNPVLPMDRYPNLPNQVNINYIISANQINFTQVLSPGANYLAGITADKTDKLNFKENKINSGTWGDWRPVALKIWDGKQNLVSDNELQGGVGLQPAGVGCIYSNYHCNFLKECVTGIQLGYTTLRDFVPTSFTPTQHDDYKIHGHFNLTTSKIYSRQNAFLPTPKGKGIGKRVPWGTDIQLYASSIYERYNMWDFPAIYELPKIDYPFGKATTAGIVHNDNRNLICGDGGVWGDIKEKSSPPFDSLSLYNYLNNSHDSTNLKWNLDYNKCRIDFGSGVTTLNYDSAIIKLVTAENEMAEGNYDNAKSIIASINSAKIHVIDYKNAYTIACNKLLSNDTSFIIGMEQPISQDTFWLDEVNFVIDTLLNQETVSIVSQSNLSDSAVSILTAIAMKNVFLQSSAAHAARALLYADKQLVFDVEKFNFFPSVSGKLDSNCTWLNTGFVKIAVLKSTGEETGIYTFADSSGFFWIGGGLLNTLDSVELYAVAAQLQDSTWVVSDSAIHHYELGLTGFKQLNCAGMSPDMLNVANSNTLHEADIQIFPNPTDGDVQIRGLKNNWEINICNVAGMQIKQITGNGKQATVQNLSPGLYIIHITDNHSSRYKHAKVLVK